MNTPATAFLQSQRIAYSEHTYEYIEHGGAGRGAEELGVPAAQVVKTLVMQDEAARPLLVLMHGDRKVSTKNLARQAGRKRIEPCKPEVAQRHCRRGFLLKLSTEDLVRALRPQLVDAALTG